MKIAVCMKRVPEMELRFSIAADRKSLDQSGLKYEISDFDGYALEVALQLVERAGPGEVVVLCLGPDGVQETLRKALAMGAARAVQLKADEVPFDGLAIAEALAAELKDGEYDLILFGRMATDTASGTVGPMTARAARPALRHRRSPTSSSRTAGAPPGAISRARPRPSQFPLPAVLTIDEGIARPRLATLKGIMAAKKKPLESEAGAARQGEPHRRVDGAAARAGRRADHRRRGRRGARAGAAAPDRSEGALMATILRVRGIPRRRASEGGVRGGDGRAAGGRRLGRWRSARAGDRRAGHRRQGGGARPLRRRRGRRRRAPGPRALQPGGVRGDRRRAAQARGLPRRVLRRVGAGPRPRAARGRASRREPRLRRHRASRSRATRCSPGIPRTPARSS